jgi:hypothetical protein
VIDEQSKEVAFRCGHKSIKNMGVFAHVQVGEDLDRLTNRRKFIVTRKRNKNFVADTADIDRRLRRQRMRQSAMKKRDHVRNP